MYIQANENILHISFVNNKFSSEDEEYFKWKMIK